MIFHPANPASPTRRARLPSAVIALGWVSLLTDLSSEMIYPLLPLFLTAVLGAGAGALGVVEGFAESAASLLKIVSGRWADRTRRRKPLVVLGYGLSGFVRPLIGFAASWGFVLAMRVLDRVGKGLRTSPRDALIADAADPRRRGAAFGFHRAMDHAGALLGPVAAWALLHGLGWSMRAVFWIAAVPAVLVLIVLAWGVREPPRGGASGPSSGRLPTLGAWRALGRDYHRLLAALVVFTLGNSSDAFLLLMLSRAGFDAGAVALLWGAHNGVRMVANWGGGRLADRLGRRSMMLAGWSLYGVVYLGFAWFESPPAVLTLFLVYGLYYGLTEPAEKAWVADLAPERLRGAAYGWYHGAVGLAALPASVLFGAIWHGVGSSAAFATGGALALAAAAMLRRVPATSPAGGTRL